MLAAIHMFQVVTCEVCKTEAFHLTCACGHVFNSAKILELSTSHSSSLSEQTPTYHNGRLRTPQVPDAIYSDANLNSRPEESSPNRL
jgi:hypothetical protein